MNSFVRVHLVALLCAAYACTHTRHRAIALHQHSIWSLLKFTALSIRAIAVRYGRAQYMSEFCLEFCTELRGGKVGLRRPYWCHLLILTQTKILSSTRQKKAIKRFWDVSEVYKAFSRKDFWLVNKGENNYGFVLWWGPVFARNNQFQCHVVTKSIFKVYFLFDFWTWIVDIRSS